MRGNDCVTENVSKIKVEKSWIKCHVTEKQVKWGGERDRDRETDRQTDRDGDS